MVTSCSTNWGLCGLKMAHTSRMVSSRMTLKTSRATQSRRSTLLGSSPWWSSPSLADMGSEAAEAALLSFNGFGQVFFREGCDMCVRIYICMRMRPFTLGKMVMDLIMEEISGMRRKKLNDLGEDLPHWLRWKLLSLIFP